MAVLTFRDKVDTISAINHKDGWQPKCIDSHEYMVIANIFCENLRNETDCETSKILLSLCYLMNSSSGRQYLNQSAIMGIHGLLPSSQTQNFLR